MYQTLLTELEQGILTVTLNRPDKLNALNRFVLEDLNKLMDQVESDANVRGVILTGAGERAFCAGSDIRQLDKYATPWDFRNRTDRARFFYSLDGETWVAIGNELKLNYTLPHFMGYRFGLFNFATQETGGFADFDFFRISDQLAANR